MQQNFESLNFSSSFFRWNWPFSTEKYRNKQGLSLSLKNVKNLDVTRRSASHTPPQNFSFAIISSNIIIKHSYLNYIYSQNSFYMNFIYIIHDSFFFIIIILMVFSSANQVRLFSERHRAFLLLTVSCI